MNQYDTIRSVTSSPLVGLEGRCDMMRSLSSSSITKLLLDADGDDLIDQLINSANANEMFQETEELTAPMDPTKPSTWDIGITNSSEFSANLEVTTKPMFPIPGSQSSPLSNDTPENGIPRRVSTDTSSSTTTDYLIGTGGTKIGTVPSSEGEKISSNINVCTMSSDSCIDDVSFTNPLSTSLNTLMAANSAAVTNTSSSNRKSRDVFFTTLSSDGGGMASLVSSTALNVLGTQPMPLLNSNFAICGQMPNAPQVNSSIALGQGSLTYATSIGMGLASLSTVTTSGPDLNQPKRGLNTINAEDKKTKKKINRGNKRARPARQFPSNQNLGGLAILLPAPQNEILQAGDRCGRNDCPTTLSSAPCIVQKSSGAEPPKTMHSQASAASCDSSALSLLSALSIPRSKGAKATTQPDSVVQLPHVPREALKHLSSQEKDEVKKERNRVHARNTRVRKKEMEENLKKTLLELVNERDAMEVDSQQKAMALEDQKKIWFLVLQDLLTLLPSAESSGQHRWDCLFTNDAVVKLPHHPTTSCNAFKATSTGANNIMESITDFHKKLCMEAYADPANCYYQCDPSSFLVDGTNAFVQLKLRVKRFNSDSALDIAANAQATGQEVELMGSLRATFCPKTNKIQKLKILVDSGIVMSRK